MINTGKCVAIFYLIIVLGCVTSPVLLDDIIVRNSIIYKDTNEAYTGHLITKFKSGKISNDILIKAGIPSGQWIVYGYQGEIVQKGSYKPVILNNIVFRDLQRVKRINVCAVEEGGKLYFDIFVVSEDLKVSVDKTTDKEFRDALLIFLKTKGIQLEISQINKITCVYIEL